MALFRFLAVVLAVVSIAARSFAAPAPLQHDGPAVARAKIAHALLALERHHDQSAPDPAAPMALPPLPVATPRGAVVREIDWSSFVAPPPSTSAAIAPVARAPPGTVREP